jgi:cytochrome b561
MTEAELGRDLELRIVPIARVAAEPRLPALLGRRPVIAPAYTLKARVLHWLSAILILLMIPLGVVIANDWGGPFQDRLYDLHRSLGITLIPLVLLRLYSRWAEPPQPLPQDIPPFQRLVAHATHGCLYGLLLVQPILGWMATSAFRAPVSVFGLFELAPICPENRDTSERLFLAHAVIGGALTALVIAHIAAALYHHFVRRDRVLMRIITG